MRVQVLAKLIVIALVEQLLDSQLPDLSTEEPKQLGDQQPRGEPPAGEPLEKPLAEELPTQRPEPSLWRLTHLASIAMLGLLAGPPALWYWSILDNANLLRERKRHRRSALQESAALFEKLQKAYAQEFMEETA